MEMCDFCKKEYNFTENNQEGFKNRCFYCTPKQIEGNPQYFIYPDGRVWSVNGKGRFLEKQPTTNGYLQINLGRNSLNNLIHRLVAIHFIANPDNLPEVDHINRDKRDNRVQNLRWVDGCENMSNLGKSNRNTSGHIGISYTKRDNVWKYQKVYRKKRIIKTFKTKAQALCYKYIILLKIKSFKKL